MSGYERGLPAEPSPAGQNGGLESELINYHLYSDANAPWWQPRPERQLIIADLEIVAAAEGAVQMLTPEPDHIDAATLARIIISVAKENGRDLSHLLFPSSNPMHAQVLQLIEQRHL